MAPTAITDGGRNRPRKNLTFSPEVHAFLSKPEVNASGLVERLVRDNVASHRLSSALREAEGDEQIDDEGAEA